MKRKLSLYLALSALLSSSLLPGLEALPIQAEKKLEIQSSNQGKEAFANAIQTSQNISSATPGVHIEKVSYLQQADYALVELDGDLYAGGQTRVSINIVPFMGYGIDSAKAQGPINVNGSMQTENSTTSLELLPTGLSCSFDLQQNPLSTITVNWKDGAGQIYTTYYLIEAKDIDLEGIWQPELEIETARDGSSATIFLEPEDLNRLGVGASIQWRRLSLQMLFDKPISSSNDFENIPGNGTTPYSHLITPTGDPSLGYAYQLVISANGATYYSNTEIIPVDNDFENDRTYYTLSSSQSSTISSYDQLLKALNISVRYLPQNPDGSASIYFEDASTYGLGQDNRFDLSKLSVAGTYNLRLIVPGNGVYATDYHDLVLTITGTSDQPSVPNNPNNPNTPNTPNTPDTPNAPSNPQTPSQPGSSSNPFLDIPEGQWFTSYVLKADELGLMHGSNGYFNPQKPLKRGDLSLILYRLAGEPDWKKLGAALPQFGDVSEGQYYYNAIMWAYIMGVVTGYKTDNIFRPDFRPEQSITRQELVTMLGRYAENVAKNPVGGDTTVYAAYPDASSVQSYASSYMAWAVSNKILTGKLINGQYYLSVNESANRDQAA